MQWYFILCLCYEGDNPPLTPLSFGAPDTHRQRTQISCDSICSTLNKEIHRKYINFPFPYTQQYIRMIQAVLLLESSIKTQRLTRTTFSSHVCTNKSYFGFILYIDLTLFDYSNNNMSRCMCHNINKTWIFGNSEIPLVHVSWCITMSNKQYIFSC